MDTCQLFAPAPHIACHLERGEATQGVGLHLHPAYPARIILLTVAGSEEKSQGLRQLLHDIHTETTSNKRGFLFSFFSNLWGVQNDVLAIGPFPGGLIRAVVLGGMDNPYRKTKTRIDTHDRFGKYHKPAQASDFKSNGMAYL